LSQENPLETKQFERHGTIPEFEGFERPKIRVNQGIRRTGALRVPEAKSRFLNSDSRIRMRGELGFKAGGDQKAAGREELLPAAKEESVKT
jgi:hypothetical protein